MQGKKALCAALAGVLLLLSSACGGNAPAQDGTTAVPAQPVQTTQTTRSAEADMASPSAPAPAAETQSAPSAQSQGFEPWEGFSLHTISSRAP